MSENRPTSEVGVDRRAETVITQQPGYAATEQVTQDVAAERRLRGAQITRIMWTVLGIAEIVLGLRFVLKLIAANPDAGFARFIYGITGALTAPFTALLGTPQFGGSSLEVTTLIAMGIYALLFWIIARVIGVAAERVTARTVTRSTREETPGAPGNERTTQHIRN